MTKVTDKKYTINQGLTLWLTGLSGSGKSTIANALYEELAGNNFASKNSSSANENIRVEILDGDALREHINKDLGFTKEDRLKNIERNAFIAGLLSKHGVLVIVPVIAPYKKARQKARTLSDNFVEVYVKASLDTVSKRDVKGLYKKALAGEIENFTGVSDPYEEPENPELTIDTENLSIGESVKKIISYLVEERYLK